MNADNQEGSDEEMEEAQNDPGDVPESAQPISEQREHPRGQNRNQI